ncbi:MAG: hypothetical protein ABWX96_21385, partial [Propionibacteriaceae bacterium]
MTEPHNRVWIPGQPRCLSCGALCDGSAAVDGQLKIPKEGDFSCCAICGNLAVFIRGPFGYGLREMTEQD